jgi:diadenosine tetraphosphatase ApaH/serine/threonine PP2A family protein phosphatase
MERAGTRVRWAALPVAVITDIHSNLPALETVLADIEARGAEEIWCLGDVVGYGADPDACTDLIAERCDLCLVGNHDLAVLGELDLAAFSEAAADAVAWTQENVAERTLEFRGDLEPACDREGVALFHASPRDPIWEYVLSLEQAYECLQAQPRRLALIGHSHVSLFFALPDGAAQEGTIASQAGDGARLALDEGGRWLLNPGSVGQPRDGDPRAAWLELDLAAQTAVFHRIAYDIDRAAASIAEAGLPERLGDRLYVGQ